MKKIFHLLKRIVRNEEPISKHINVLTHYDDDTLLDKSGKLIKIIKMNGLDFATKDLQTLDAYKYRRNNLLKSFSSEFALYFWEVKRKTVQYPDGTFNNSYADEVNKKYKNRIETAEMFHAELYIGIITKQPEGLIAHGFSFFQRLNHWFDKKSKADYLVARHQELNDVTRKILNSLADYECELLGVYEKNGCLFSGPLEFLSKLINFDAVPIAVNIIDAAKILPRKRLFFKARPGTIEMRAADGSNKFAAMLSIKGYTPKTYQGLLNELSSLRCEYTLTQSYRFYDSQNAKANLRDQQNDMLQTKDVSVSQTIEIDDAFDETASGSVGYGKHHFTLACYADSQEELNKHIGTIVSRFSDINITCVREDIACECAFWSQFPGNFAYVLRAADISTKNMAAFASLHNYAIGKRYGNHWGDAVTVLESLSGSPFYFNFHYKDVGNFLIFGAMGSGKTVLVGFLILQSMKFGGKRIIFDKDRGLEIMVRAMDGLYEIIKPGVPTGFNPCQLEDTPSNRQFLITLFKKMLSVNGEILTEHDLEVIVKAIDGLYRFDVIDRQLQHIASFFGTKHKGSLRARFDQWHSDGAYAWLFDNPTDTLNLNPDVLGFDLSKILDDEICKAPALLYLIHRVEQVIEGDRGVLFIDEASRVLFDADLKNLISDWSRIPRKKNNIFGLATQVTNDAVYSSVGKAIIESAFCKIFFPNPSADRNIYVGEYGLSEYEYHRIKTLPDDAHYFLLVHGNGVNRQSVIVRLNLTGMEDLIGIISGREETVALLDQICLEVGNDPKHWLPIFNYCLKEKVPYEKASNY